jgi:hypothetical protein
MELTYSQKDEQLDKIAADLVMYEAGMNNNKQAVSLVASGIAAMATTYATIIAQIDADLAAAPNDAGLQIQKTRKDALVAEFLAQNPRAQAMNDAIKNL